jgi:hypothetical protein
MRRAIAVGAVGIGLVAAIPSALAAHRAHPLPKMATAAPFHVAPNFAVRPHTVWYTGDDTGILGRLPKGAPAVGKRPGFLHWKTWTRERAFAVGTDWAKNCVPNCAFSRFYRNSVTVTLTQPRHGHFVKMTLRDTIRGKQVTSTWCNYPGYTYWTLPPRPGGHDCPGPHAV